MGNIRTRFAPSPTGSMHIGNLRTALYAYVLAKSVGGEFILRIEDTDKKREKAGGVDEIKKLLGIFGLNWDEYYIQSERVAKGIYEKAAQKLVSDGHAFYCQCEARNAKLDGFSKDLRDLCRNKNLKSGAVKLKVPDGEKVTFDDFILKKNISWDTSTVSDTTLLKSDGFPTYHLAVVVDDTDMSITHVLRGHAWLPSTPIHLLVYKYLGLNPPEIGHLTDILDPEGGKLSKRRGSTSCEGLLKEGYLPEAILNFIMLTGWAPKDNREIYSLSDFVSAFDPNGFQVSNPVYNRDKLDWFNGHYIRNTSDTKLVELIGNIFEDKYDMKVLQKSVPLVKERITKLSDYADIAGFFFNEPKVDKSLLGENFKKHLESARVALTNIEKWIPEEMNKKLMDEVNKNAYKTGQFFMDLRITVTGRKITPPLNESMEILGKENTLKRIETVLSG